MDKKKEGFNSIAKDKILVFCQIKETNVYCWSFCEECHWWKDYKCHYYPGRIFSPNPMFPFYRKPKMEMGNGYIDGLEFFNG